MTRWGEIQPPMFALVNSLVCVFCGGMIVAAARWMSGRVVATTRRRQDDEASKPANAPQTTPLSFSTIAGYLTMAASFACLLVAPIAKSHPAWLVVAIVLSSIAEILISSLGLAQVAKLTPRHLQPIYTSIWFVTSGIGGQLAGWLGSLELLTGFRVLVTLCLTGAVVAGSLKRKLDV
jgi:dipeptide/tripeptide permease